MVVSTAVQTAVSISSYDELSRADEIAAIGGVAIAKHLRQPRGADFVPYLGKTLWNGVNIGVGEYLRTTSYVVAANQSTLVFPKEDQAQQSLQQGSESPFRVSGEEHMRSNTPLRDGPGPLHLHSPGLSPIINKVQEKENTVAGQESDKKGREKFSSSTSTEGIAYRQALRELDNMPSNSKSHTNTRKESSLKDKIISQSRNNEGEEESKLLSMEMLNDTTLTNAPERNRAFNLPTHHQLHRDSQPYQENQHHDSSLEVMSLLVDQSSSMSTPQRDTHSLGRKLDLGAGARSGGVEDSLAFISPLKASAQKETPKLGESQHTAPASASATESPTLQQQQKPVAFGIDIDGRTGSPVIVPLTNYKAAPIPAAMPFFGRSAVPSSSSSLAPSSFGGVHSRGGGLMSSGFWRERMSRRSMSSVLSSPAAAAAM